MQMGQKAPINGFYLLFILSPKIPLPSPRHPLNDVKDKKRRKDNFKILIKTENTCNAIQMALQMVSRRCFQNVCKDFVLLRLCVCVCVSCHCPG